MSKKKEFPKDFPFWARFKLNKKRTTLVIDEDIVLNKKRNKIEDAFVHREATHSYKKDFEKIYPNPDKTDKEPMYLKRPRKHPKRMFEAHNKKLDMSKYLKTDIKKIISRHKKRVIVRPFALFTQSESLITLFEMYNIFYYLSTLYFKNCDDVDTKCAIVFSKLNKNTVSPTKM